jgi:MerR family transcriptional regulator, copper efflux regulator
MTDLPIACSLTAEQLPARREALAAFDVVDARVTGRVTVRRSAAAEAALAEFVQLENECCPFFDLRVITEPDVLILEVGGPPDAEPLILQLVEEFR